MNKPVADHLRKALAEEDIGVVVHLGAGIGAELPIYLAAKPAHIRLLEPNPAAAKALQLAVAHEPSVTVDVRAVSGHDGTATLRVFNFATFSSLHSPRELLRLFPGLHTVFERQVVTVTVATLMAELTFAEGLRNILIVDAPGEEGRVVEDMRAGEWLRRFDYVFLHGGTSQHYEGSPLVDGLRGLLEAEGFRLEATSLEDPDRPWLVLQLDRTTLKQIKALTTERDKATVALELALQMQALLQSDIEELRSRYEQAEKTRADQELLLRKLAPQLREAARHLQTVHLQHDQQAELAGDGKLDGNKSSEKSHTVSATAKKSPPDAL